MDILMIAGFAMTAAILAVVLRKYHPEFAVLVGLAGGVLLLLYVIIRAQPAFTEISSLFERANVNTQYGVILLKSLGICFVAQLASDTCSDAGESAIASKIELAGKFAVLLVSLPLFEEIAKLAIGLMD